MNELRKEPGHGWLGPTYIRERREVERWLRDGHRANGGEARDEHPIYLSLWPDLPPLGPHDIVVDLGRLAPGTLSFTYPDSMISFGLAFRMRAGEERERRPYHGRVFDTDGVASVVADYGWPQEQAGRERRSRYDRSVEVQVWDHGPLLRIASRVQRSLPSKGLGSSDASSRKAWRAAPAPAGVRTRTTETGGRAAAGGPVPAPAGTPRSAVQATSRTRRPPPSADPLPDDGENGSRPNG